VRGVADHQRASGRRAALGHQLHQHARIGLAGGLVGGAGGVEQAFELDAVERRIEAASRLASGHRDALVARLQRMQQLKRTVEQHQLVLALEVVVAVTRTELGVACRRQTRRGMRERIVQPEANDKRRLLVARYRHAQIGARLLDAAHDQRGGVEQRAVPVEGDQVEAVGSSVHLWIVNAARTRHQAV
jgi:hypothetical protein